MSQHLGLDLGGTNIKVAVVEEHSGEMSTVGSFSRETPARGTAGDVADALIASAKEATERWPAIGTLGVGVPGLFDATNGHTLLLPNTTGDWDGFPLADRLCEGTGMGVVMLNDARAFTLAEGTLGAGRGARVLVGMTLGTGIGGGIMIDGRLHLGAFGTAGEIGHQTVEPDGPPCGCGNRGCVEALTRSAVVCAAAERETMESVFEGVAEGDSLCVSAVEDAARYLGIGLANVVTVLGPDRIVVGGGVAAAGELILGPIRDELRSRTRLVPTDALQVVAASLGPFAGAHGAAIAGATQAPVRSR